MRILANTYFDDAAIAATVPGAIDADWPLANLQSTYRKEVMKTTGTGQVTLRIDLGASQQCSGLGIVETDLSPGADITLRAYADDAYSQLQVEQAWSAIGPITKWGDARWGEFPYGGLPTPEELAYFPRPAYGYWLSEGDYLARLARYWELEINNGATEFYLGRVLLGPLWEPVNNAAYGAKVQRVSPSKVIAPRNAIFTNRLEQYWSVNFSFPMRDSEVQGEFARLVSAVGVDKDFLLELRSDADDRTRCFYTYYGRFEDQAPAVTMANYNHNTAPVRFREVVE